MEPTSITPKLLPGADTKAVEEYFFLTEEAAIRNRLELKVERALYRAAVALQSGCDRHERSCDSSLNYFWRNEDRVKIAFEQATVALRELRDHQLYCSSHRCARSLLPERDSVLFWKITSPPPIQIVLVLLLLGSNRQSTRRFF